MVVTHKFIHIIGSNYIWIIILILDIQLGKFMVNLFQAVYTFINYKICTTYKKCSKKLNNCNFKLIYVWNELYAWKDMF